MEECLQRNHLPLPIMLQTKGTVLNISRYRMGNEIALALAAALSKKVEKIEEVQAITREQEFLLSNSPR